MMLRFICAHCQADLGDATPNAPEPVCPDHQNGTVVIVEVRDGD